MNELGTGSLGSFCLHGDRGQGVSGYDWSGSGRTHASSDITR